MASSAKIHIFCAAVPYGDIDGKLFPDERQKQIDSVRNPALRLQKISSWNLLSDAFKIGLGVDMRQLSFSMSNSGKWSCDRLFFSISHCKELVAVAVSEMPCGIDIEKDISGRFNSSLAKRILSDSEHGEYKLLTENEKNEYVLQKWTQKESIYKMDGVGAFSPSTIQTNDFFTETRTVSSLSDSFCMTVSALQRCDTEYTAMSEKLFVSA